MLPAFPLQASIDGPQQAASFLSAFCVQMACRVDLRWPSQVE